MSETPFRGLVLVIFHNHNQLIKDRTTLGRRPYTDVVIDNLAVSGEHAVINMSGSEVVLVECGDLAGGRDVDTREGLSGPGGS